MRFSLELIQKKNEFAKRIKSGNYYRTINIINYETKIDEDGSKIEIPKETIEYIEINYCVWLLQLILWVIVVIFVIIF